MLKGFHMRWPLATAFSVLLLSAPVWGDEALQSRFLTAPVMVPNVAPADFDLIDFRAAERAASLAPTFDVAPHSRFDVKRHLGFAGGYDNGVGHASIGYYLTIAEWGRWNFGVPAIEFGYGRYPVYDRDHKRRTMTSQTTLIVSMASVHYRIGYLRALGINGYLNLEQVYDLRDNQTGSQFGLSFSRK
jgi:hypothetical protein